MLAGIYRFAFTKFPRQPQRQPHVERIAVIRGHSVLKFGPLLEQAGSLLFLMTR